MITSEGGGFVTSCWAFGEKISPGESGEDDGTYGATSELKA